MTEGGKVCKDGSLMLFLVEVVVRGAKMTQAGSSWGKKVITP
jgi:hypothetical protein